MEPAEDMPWPLRDQCQSENIRRVIFAFLKETGMPDTAFGRKAVNDPALIRQLREGREMRLKTASKCLEWILDQRPRGCPDAKPDQRGKNLHAKKGRSLTSRLTSFENMCG